MPQVVVVAIHITHGHPLYDPHTKKTAEEQIHELTQTIDNICKTLMETEANAEHWIIAWREAGITDKDNHFIRKPQLQKLKQAMTTLTTSYPKLMIIAGSIATMRDIPQEQLQERTSIIFKFYGDNQHIAVAEENVKDNYFNSDRHKFKEHQNQARQHWMDAIGRKQNARVVRNTCYIFENGKCIARHDKIAPIAETKNITYAMFQPGNKKGNKSYINSLCGIEICREHDFSVLKQECMNTTPPTPAPLVHFLLSHSIKPELDHAFGRYFIHIDSREKISFVSFKEHSISEANNDEVKLYSADLTSTGHTLKEIKEEQPLALMTKKKE